MWGYRRIEDVGFPVRSLAGDSCPFDDRFAIRSLRITCLDRFPVFSIQRGDKKCRKERFTDACICAGYEEIRTHPCTTSVSRAATRALRKRSISPRERFALREIRMREVPTGTVGGR